MVFQEVLEKCKKVVYSLSKNEIKRHADLLIKDYSNIFTTNFNNLVANYRNILLDEVVKFSFFKESTYVDKILNEDLVLYSFLSNFREGYIIKICDLVIVYDQKDLEPIKVQLNELDLFLEVAKLMESSLIHFFMFQNSTQAIKELEHAKLKSKDFTIIKDIDLLIKDLLEEIRCGSFK